MTREMQDGINSDAAGMDHNIPLVAYYIDGPYAWTPAEIALFPRSKHVRIATRWTTRDGHVIDRENGDATAAEAAAWAHNRRVDGFQWPTVYSSVSNFPEALAAFDAIREPYPLKWGAHYDNLDVLPSGFIAKQYADPGPLDKSIVADYWPGVDDGGVMTTPNDFWGAPVWVHYNSGSPEAVFLIASGYPANVDGSVDIHNASGGQWLAVAATRVAMLESQMVTLSNRVAQIIANQSTELTAVQALNTITPATMQQPIHDALISLGWVPPPTAADTAVAVLATIKAQFDKA